MRGVNRVILVATLVADPETRYSAGGTAVCNARMATNESWTDKNTGQKQERAEFHRVTFFGKLAEIAGEYLKKGRQVYVEGSLRTDKYTDKDGVERYATSIIASEMQMLGGKPEGGERDQAPRETGGGQRTGATRAQRASHATPAPNDFDDDDLPF